MAKLNRRKRNAKNANNALPRGQKKPARPRQGTQKPVKEKIQSDAEILAKAGPKSKETKKSPRPGEVVETKSVEAVNRRRRNREQGDILDQEALKNRPRPARSTAKSILSRARKAVGKGVRQKAAKAAKSILGKARKFSGP
jgi:hypothetical protein